jgi:hypothetical protein
MLISLLPKENKATSAPDIINERNIKESNSRIRIVVPCV